jgi:hypothetical protein
MPKPFKPKCFVFRPMTKSETDDESEIDDESETASFWLFVMVSNFVISYIAESKYISAYIGFSSRHPTGQL